MIRPNYEHDIAQILDAVRDLLNKNYPAAATSKPSSGLLRIRTKSNSTWCPAMEPIINGFTITDLTACARRELAKRKRAYPRWVRDGYMKQPEADREIAMMRAITEHFEDMKEPKLF
jgi:hypothetical protein